MTSWETSVYEITNVRNTLHATGSRKGDVEV